MTPSPPMPSLGSSIVRVFDLSLGQMLWSRRSVFLALLLGGPVLMSLAIRILSSRLGPIQVNGGHVPGNAVFGIMIWLLYKGLWPIRPETVEGASG